jgi:hypothetical protein
MADVFGLLDHEDESYYDAPKCWDLLPQLYIITLQKTQTQHTRTSKSDIRKVI